jgi:hypothetical protein
MNRWPAVVLLLALAGFGLGLRALFQDRFATGDNYPAYSSLRADPLGTKALHDSAARLASARRNFRPLTRLETASGDTLLFLGVQPGNLRFEEEEFHRLETFVRGGGRLVFALHPAIVRPRWTFVPTNSPARPAEDRWGFTIQFNPLERGQNDGINPALAERTIDDDDALPEEITVRTGHWFSLRDDHWRVIYQRATNQPVLVERRWGDGAIVLCADSYPFSNEALRDDRQSALLAWCLGAARAVVFDETHLGAREEPGVATLARKYRLHGFLASLLVLAALFVWQSMLPFPPAEERAPSTGPADAVTGRDAAAGFVNLLRRNIRPADLLAVCLDQWNAHVARMRRPSQARLEAMQSLIDAQNALEPRQRDPVATYRQFCEILRRKT